jgi:AraC-like DNA-binding protein
VPAHIWIRRRRIEFAQSLMLTTDAPLSEIALSCGLGDQSNFTRLFRRIVGETPSSWRRTRCGAIEERVTDLAYVPADQAPRSRTGAVVVRRRRASRSRAAG